MAHGAPSLAPWATLYARFGPGCLSLPLNFDLAWGRCSSVMPMTKRSDMSVTCVGLGPVLSSEKFIPEPRGGSQYSRHRERRVAHNPEGS